MKISKKIIGIGVASLGMLFSVGGALALYTQAASDASFHISAVAYAGSTSIVTYKINNTAGDSVANPAYYDSLGENTGDAVRPDFPQIKYEFALSAAFANDLPAQTYVMGNVNVSLTNLDSSLYGKVTVYAALEGYTAGKAGATYFAATPLINDVLIENGETVCTGNRDISVATAGTQKLVVWVKLANFNNISLNEIEDFFDLAVSWGQISNGFDPAYVVGNGNQWTKDDEFAMAVNIEANSYEWMYEGLAGTMGEAKVVCGETWSSEVGNVLLDSETTYDVYWTAGNSANFAARP